MSCMRTKEVFYSEYCHKCENWKIPETDDPCDDCLTQPWNEDSHRPINYKKQEEDDVRRS